MTHKLRPTTPANSFAEARAVFDSAWAHETNTAIELPPVDVNDVLARQYTLSHPYRVTRTDLWDMEVRKAWDPATYIPYVVRAGRSWGSTTLVDGSRRHLRTSVQRGWITERAGTVLEEVVADDAAQSVIFLGHESVHDDAGRMLHRSPFQPLFHVEHGVGGTDEEPLNLWRIVLVTDHPEQRYLKQFDQVTTAGWLPGFLEIYLRRDLGLEIERLPREV